ncbi:hypothetical protein GGI07_001869 [Coemansia sp. Benny D115]|nr:hypothetical protein GGI07_001869 [Coemansia sp. Benny D115]
MPNCNDEQVTVGHQPYRHSYHTHERAIEQATGPSNLSAPSAARRQYVYPEVISAAQQNPQQLPPALANAATAPMSYQYPHWGPQQQVSGAPAPIYPQGTTPTPTGVHPGPQQVPAYLGYDNYPQAQSAPISPNKPGQLQRKKSLVRYPNHLPQTYAQVQQQQQILAAVPGATVAPVSAAAYNNVAQMLQLAPEMGEQPPLSAPMPAQIPIPEPHHYQHHSHGPFVHPGPMQNSAGGYYSATNSPTSYPPAIVPPPGNTGTHVHRLNVAPSKAPMQPGSPQFYPTQQQQVVHQRPLSRPLSRPTSRPTSRPQSRPSSRPHSPTGQTHGNKQPSAGTHHHHHHHHHHQQQQAPPAPWWSRPSTDSHDAPGPPRVAYLRLNERVGIPLENKPGYKCLLYIVDGMLVYDNGLTGEKLLSKGTVHLSSTTRDAASYVKNPSKTHRTHIIRLWIDTEDYRNYASSKTLASKQPEFRYEIRHLADSDKQNCQLTLLQPSNFHPSFGMTSRIYGPLGASAPEADQGTQQGENKRVDSISPAESTYFMSQSMMFTRPDYFMPDAQSAIVSLHPQTTQVVLQQETESSNILVGYVSVAVNKPTSLTNLTVYLSGEQQLDWRQGQGPIQMPCLTLWPALSGMQQSIGGFASIQALASTPLHLNTQIRNGWKLNVYSASMVLVLGSQTKIQAFVARTDTNSSCDSAGAPVSLEIVEFSASLHEKIVHKVSKSLSTETKDTVSFSTSTSNSSTFASHQRPRGLINDSCVSEKNPHLTTPDTSTDDQWLDIQMIDTLGESLDSLLLPTVASLHLSLPTKPTNDHPTNSGGVQPSSCSAVFSVTHELKINVSVRKVSSANNNNNNNQNTVHRVELVSPVVVLPEAIDDDHCSYAAAVTSALLPCYKEISNDVILAASPSSSTMDLSCLFGRSESHQHALPPAYANTAM